MTRDTSPLNTSPLNSPAGGRLARALRYKVPASSTPEGKARLRAYYEALGRFVDMFSQAETAITQTLWAYAQTKAEIAKIVLSGIQAKNAVTLIKQLAEANGADRKKRADLENVLQQFGVLLGVRNDVLHYGATLVAEGKAVVSNALKAKGAPVIFPISPDSLGEMTEDLQKIVFHLNYRHLGRAQPLSAASELLLGAVFHAPWRYKHQPQPTSKTMSARSRTARKRDPSPPRRQRASRG